MATPQSVADVVKRNPSKRGLAIIVTNDYSTRDAGLSPLDGPKKDGARMRDVFNQLKIATIWRKNVRHDELAALLFEVASLSSCPQSYETISFVFSGHGLETGEVFLQDGSKMHVQEIVHFLLPQNARNIGNIPKLFFIDACRGAASTEAVLVPRSAGGPDVQRGHLLRRGVSERGGSDVKTVLVPHDGNTLVAYSTTTKKKAMESEEGGIWMKKLALKLVQSKESIETVLTEVREDLIKDYQDPQWKGNMQLPETVSHLCKPVYLHPDTLPRDPFPPVGPAAPPGLLTQRDSSHPGYYRGRFLHFEQRNIIKSVTEEYENNFICVLTFIKCSNGRRHQFRSEKEFQTKADAKESAAKLAVRSLDKEAATPPQMRCAPNKPNSHPNKPPVETGRATSCGAATNLTKDPKSKLKEHCEKNQLPQPKYEEVKCGGQLHQQRVIVGGRVFTGAPHGTKKEAEKSAAQKALNGLKIQ